MHLAPTFIHQARRQNDLVRLARLHPQDCIACGCCSFICPANIPLVEQVTQAKAAIEEGGGL